MGPLNNKISNENEIVRISSSNIPEMNESFYSKDHGRGPTGFQNKIKTRRRLKHLRRLKNSKKNSTSLGRGTNIRNKENYEHMRKRNRNILARSTSPTTQSTHEKCKVNLYDSIQFNSMKIRSNEYNINSSVRNHSKRSERPVKTSCKISKTPVSNTARNKPFIRNKQFDSKIHQEKLESNANNSDASKTKHSKSISNTINFETPITPMFEKPNSVFKKYLQMSQIEIKKRLKSRK